MELLLLELLELLQLLPVLLQSVGPRVVSTMAWTCLDLQTGTACLRRTPQQEGRPSTVQI